MGFFLKVEASRRWRDASEEIEVLYIDGLKDGEKLIIIQILRIMVDQIEFLEKYFA